MLLLREFRLLVPKPGRDRPTIGQVIHLTAFSNETPTFSEEIDEEKGLRIGCSWMLRKAAPSTRPW
jgi:hypothetical protein